MPKQIFNPLSGNFDQVIDQAVEVKYAPSTTTDWAGTLPTDVKEALDNLANRTESFAALNNPQAIYVDAIAGDNTFGTGGILAPVQSIYTALTFVTDPSKYYVLHLAPGTYLAGGQAIPGNVSIVGNEAEIQGTVSLTAAAGSSIAPLYDGVDMTITMDLSAATVALPVFQNASFDITRTDSATGARFIQMFNSSNSNLDIKGNIAVFNSLFTGTATIRDGGALICNASVVGIAITAESQATITFNNSTFVGSITGTTVGLNTTLVRSDSVSLSYGGTITGCNFQYLDTADHVGYTPAIPANWSTTPTTVKEGLDTLETDKFDYPTGLASQYIRGDGTLANFPTSSGGGSSVSYYLNGGIASDVSTYYQMSKTPVVGSNADFTVNSGITTLAAQFMTDAGDPDLLAIPAGNWNFELFLSASSSGGTPTFYVELYKYDGATSTLIASGSGFPESITAGTAIDLYTTAIAIPATSLALTDRLEVRVYVTRDGRDITLHTQDSHLCQVITTFSTGINALNGLTDQVQYLATDTTGTDFTISSSGDTHTFSIPDSSATARGLLTSVDWANFDGKVNDGVNLGAGEGVFKQKSGTDLEFKTLVAGPGIVLTPSTTEIEITTQTAPAELSYLIQTFSGDSLTTSFTLSPAAITKDSLLVFIDGVYQEQGAYSYSSPTLLFTSAPPTGTNNIEVRFQTSDVIVLETPRIEVYNATIAIPFGVSTMTGLLHFKMPVTSNIVITQVQLFEKNGVTSGTLEVDVKKNSTPNNTGMTSIFSVKPSFDFATASDYDISTGTVGTSAVAAGNYLRLDITSVPSGFVGNIQVAVYAA